MNSSPLQLETYFVHELSFKTNENFDPEKKTAHDLADLQVTPIYREIQEFQKEGEGDGGLLAVELNIEYQVGEEQNTPYSFNITILGYFSWLPDVKIKDRTKAFRVNGPSMLFGMAREIIRAETARGPYPSTTLPSVSFLSFASEKEENTSGV